MRTARHRWPRWHSAGRVLAVSLRMVPRVSRWRAATYLSTLLTPLLRRTAAFRELRSSLSRDRARDISLHLVLNTLTLGGTVFDVPFRVEGGEELESALRSGRGVLFIATHTVHSSLITRFLHDIGSEPKIIAPELLPVPGTRAVARTLQPSRTLLVDVRTRLRNGELVCAMIDRSKEERTSTVEFATAQGSVRVSDALIRIAARSQARVIFAAARAEGPGVVVVQLGKPDDSRLSGDGITRDFVAFLQAHSAQVAAAGRPR